MQPESRVEVFFHSVGVNLKTKFKAMPTHAPTGTKDDVVGEVFKQGTQNSKLQRLAEHPG